MCEGVSSIGRLAQRRRPGSQQVGDMGLDSMGLVRLE